jgi:uncharacterized protein YbjT (DUF2867 family)
MTTTNRRENSGGNPKPKVVIAGASGFIGHTVIRALQGRYEIVALSRTTKNNEPGIEWRSCDLFSLLQCEKAVAGADYAIYLVHSMLPAALTQANFEDMDLILADNFARAASKAGVRQIIYLGGLVPDETEDLSRHLASRLEVEQVLGARDVPLTSLRAALVIGAGGSSFRIMLRLVERLPAMISPKWTLSNTQPIALDDLVRSIVWCIGREEAMGRTYDVGGAEIMTYLEMMQRTAQARLGKRRFIVTVPFFSPGLSVLWVRLITGAHRELIRPLVQSLRHPMCVNRERAMPPLATSTMSFDAALRAALDGEKKIAAKKAETRAHLSRSSTPDASGYVVSIQRLPLPTGRDARWVAEEYARWLPRLLKHILRVHTDENFNIEFHLTGLSGPLLELKFSPERSTSDRPLYYITGGRLAGRPVLEHRRSPARLEFRETPDGRSVMAAIFNFRPSLPWFVYRNSQAIIHMIVMRLFARHLRRWSADRGVHIRQNDIVGKAQESAGH